jgi:hypothetical protein
MLRWGSIEEEEEEDFAFRKKQSESFVVVDLLRLNGEMKSEK